MDLLHSLISNVGLLEIIIFIGGIAFFAAELKASTKAHQDLLNSEISHVVNLIEINHNNLKEDIQRLEKKQEESNRIKERLAMQEVIVADLQELLRTHLTDNHTA
jgi:hypothetical protein